MGTVIDGYGAEPLRRGDILNSITKLAGERVRQRGDPIPTDVP